MVPGVIYRSTLQIPCSNSSWQKRSGNFLCSLRRPTIIRPHTLGEPWMPAEVPRLWKRSIHLSALASMFPDCGDVSFCSVRSSLPASSIHLSQAFKTPPTGCTTKLLTAHPTIFHTLSTRQSSCFWSLAPPRSPRLVASSF